MVTVSLTLPTTEWHPESTCAPRLTSATAASPAPTQLGRLFTTAGHSGRPWYSGSGPPGQSRVQMYIQCYQSVHNSCVLLTLSDWGGTKCRLPRNRGSEVSLRDDVKYTSHLQTSENPAQMQGLQHPSVKATATVLSHS